MIIVPKNDKKNHNCFSNKKIIIMKAVAALNQSYDIQTEFIVLQYILEKVLQIIVYKSLLLRIYARIFLFSFIDQLQI